MFDRNTRTIVFWLPFDPAEVAELVTAFASHMWAAINFLKHHFAFGTLPKMIVLFEVFYTILIALSFMEFMIADRTKLFITYNAMSWISFDTKCSLTILFRAYSLLLAIDKKQIFFHPCIFLLLYVVNTFEK